MLTRRIPAAVPRGFSLIVTLIALAIMALAAVSLMRTVSTSTLVSGNLAFEQAAVTGADVGVEAAIAWLEANSNLASAPGAAPCAPVGATVLTCNQALHGYLAVRKDPHGAESWADLWAELAGIVTPVARTTDGAGNTASYLIQRMCSAVGDPGSLTGCSNGPGSSYCGGSKQPASNAGAGSLACPSATYYRITVQVLGPRGTTAYIQTMVAL